MRSFKIYGIWPQASKQADTHTTSANAVTLVWGSLRLPPTKLLHLKCHGFSYHDSTTKILSCKVFLQTLAQSHHNPFTIHRGGKKSGAFL